MSLEDTFRKLRLIWFNYHLMSRPSEREWEEETRSELRERNNQYLLEKYNNQTERIIKGEDLNIAPTCAFDMTEK